MEQLELRGNCTAISQHKSKTNFTESPINFLAYTQKT